MYTRNVKVDLGIWSTLNRLIVLLLMIAAILAVAVWYIPVIEHNEKMRREIYRLQARISEEEETARKLDISIRNLRTDPKSVERAVREKLGYAKPGETVFFFDQGR